MFNTKTKVVVYSHGILVMPATYDARRALIEFCYSLAQYSYNRTPPTWKMEKKVDRVFAAATKDRREFRFHRNMLNEVALALSSRGVRKDSIEYVYKEIPKYVKVEFDTKNLMEPYPEQLPIIEHLSKPNVPIKITNAQTGRGKTLMALWAMCRLQARTMIQIQGGYVKRWLPDLKEKLGLKPKELVVVRGRDHLLSIINLAKNDDLKDVKVIIITSKTMYNFLKAFEEGNGQSIYNCRPEELHELLGVGLKLVDEVHEDYHLNFKTDIYTNVANGIYLSATLETKDAFRARMYSIAHPQDCWKSLKYDAYVDVRAKHYTLNDASVEMKTSQRGKTDYSHSAYETWILGNDDIKNNYMRIILESFYREFLTETPYEHGQKCLIFCSLVEMCETVAEFLKTKLFDLNIGVYVSGSDQKILSDCDIIVSTVESCGTAIDIPGLKVVCLTRAIDKFEKNEQIKGRLRKMSGKWAHIRPILVYLNNMLIPKHMDYHNNKKEYWKGLVYSLTEHNLKQRL